MTTLAEFRRRPSALAYMAGALRPRARLDPVAGLPPLRLQWHGLPIERGELARFAALTGLGGTDSAPVLYLHVTGFRLLMALLTHPAWPLPIWGALQVRNHLLQHLPLPVGCALELEARVAGHRVLEKGLEADLHTVARLHGRPAWESLVTFYYRGRFGPGAAASPLARAPDGEGPEIARWRSGRGGGLRFGRLTGDYNGIHLWTPYARLLGFRRAFHHPQLVLGQCLARLPAPDARAPQRLDAWLKGPVFHGCELALHAAPEQQGTVFHLYARGEPRPAIVGTWSAAAEPCGLAPTAPGPGAAA